MTRLLTLIIILCLLTTAAQASHHHRATPACDGWFCGLGPAPTAKTHQFPALGRAGTVVGHPSGCPGRAFCGCGASVRVFGHPVRSLYLAANWLRFPRAAPAPGMAVARRHHVMVLESHVGGNDWLVYDANSGRHATRVHVRSIAGYTIVNPRA